MGRREELPVSSHELLIQLIAEIQRHSALVYFTITGSKKYRIKHRLEGAAFNRTVATINLRFIYLPAYPVFLNSERLLDNTRQWLSNLLHLL